MFFAVLLYKDVLYVAVGCSPRHLFGDENNNLYILSFSPNSVSTLWGSYGRSKEWCPSRCPSATAAFDCAGTHRVPFASTVSHGMVAHGMVAAGFWVVLPGVRALFEAKRGFT